MAAGRRQQSVMVPVARRAVVLALLLGALVIAADQRWLTLLAWTDRCVPVERYPALFGVYFLTWVGARAGARRVVMLAGSLACAAVFDPAFALLSLVWIVGLHRTLGRRAALPYVLATYAALAIVCNRALWPGFLAAHSEVARWGYVFAVGYTFRLAWLLHQVKVQRGPAMPLGDVVTYLMFAPFFVIVPYMLAIPRCDQFRAGLERHDDAVERSGLRLMAWGLALAGAAALLARVYSPMREAYAAYERGRYLAALGHGLVWYPAIAVVEACGIAGILVGMVRVLGIELGPSFDRPLLATSITGWWRRWNTHFRDLLVALFYYPVVLRHRRTPVRATVLGCAWVFLVGSVVFHWPKLYFRDGAFTSLPVGTLAESAVMFAVVAFALVREQRRPHAPRMHPALGVITTALLVFLAVVAVGYGVQGLWNTHVSTSSPRPFTPRSSDVFPIF